MKDYIINVVSYKRPNNNTCKLLAKTNLTWRVFVYKFDPYLEEYIKNYKTHVYVIKSLERANLAKKRQLVLDMSIFEMYKYCLMLDDDIYQMTLRGKKCNIEDAIEYMLKMIKTHNIYIALSAAYNKSKTLFSISKYKNICNNSVFNLKLYRKVHNIRYNENSKCEDMEFTIDLILRNCITGRLEKLIINNILQGGTTNDGLFYRFSNTNRFIEEGSYMSEKYKYISNLFSYDENHFKMNSDALIKYIKTKEKK